VADRTAARLAWSALALVLLLAVVDVALAIGTGRTPDVAGLLFLSFPVVGALVAARQPRNAVGWVMLGIGGLHVVGVLAVLYWWAATTLVPGRLPGADVALAVTGPLWVPLIGTMGAIVPLIFPDGHLPSPRWRPVLVANVVALVALSLLLLVWPGTLEVAGLPDRENPLGIAALEPYRGALFVAILVVPLGVVVAAAGLVHRFRRAHGLERVQLKWFVASVTVVGSTYAVLMLLHVPYGGEQPPAWLDATSHLVATFVLIPVSIGIAILRHRLYDIDRLINRTVVYVTLTAVASGVYLAAVTVAQVLLRPTTGGSELAVATSTLLAAAVLRPARRRIQAATDRRFDRSRYDAARTVAAYAATVRRETDLDTLVRGLPVLVGQVLAPEHVTLWLPPPATGGPSAAGQA
jgi:hypothetical protein